MLKLELNFYEMDPWSLFLKKKLKSLSVILRMQGYLKFLWEIRNLNYSPIQDKWITNLKRLGIGRDSVDGMVFN